MKVPELMIRRISLIILLIVALNSLETSFSKNYAFAAQPGQSCTKVGSTSSSLICTKVKTKLIWQRSKKQQTISTSSPSKISSTSQTISKDNSASPITISNTRVTSDQVDVVNGFQIKAVYVVPSDGVDHTYDTNGYIAGILNEGNEYLHSQLNLRIPVDKTGVGYDIQFLKSKLPTSYFLTTTDLTDKLLVESRGLENPGLNRKNYIFFIDVNTLVDGKTCGYAALSTFSAVVAIGKGIVNGTSCTGKTFNFKNFAAGTWPHELFHNLGVNHTPDDPCDLMGGKPETSGTCSWNGVRTIDKDRSRYVSSSAQGQDILKLRVWEGYTDRQDISANCSLNPVPRSDGVNYAYCPTGTQTIGALKNCWSSINSVVLEEYINGEWRNLGSGKHFSAPWGPAVAWKCPVGYTAPWKQLTITTPGISLYRWMINGSESEQFKVIWVR